MLTSCLLFLGCPSSAGQRSLRASPPSEQRGLSPDIDYPVWTSISDSVNENDQSCFHFHSRLGTSSTTGVETFDYFTTRPDKWVGELYKFGCSHPRPDWTDKTYLTFLAKIEGGFESPCKPSISISGGGWGQCGNGWCSTGAIPLIDSYVDHGQVVSDEWRRVAIPLADFRTADWTLTNIVQLGFQSCGTAHNVQPTYNIADIKTTNYEVSVVLAGVATESPSSSPTEATWPIWTSAADSIDGTDPTKSCFEFQSRLGTTSKTGVESFDYFTTRPDKWVGELYNFGCSTPPYKMDWSDKTYLTFLAKIEGAFVSPCKPSINIIGGNWNQCGSGWCSTGGIALQGTYVDAGSLVADEWRTVAIPLDDFRTRQWKLDNIVKLAFDTCGGDHNVQPTYNIADIKVTNHYVDLMSEPPSLAPSEYWTHDVLLATHRTVHHHWYPLLGADREPEGNSWVVASNNQWPTVDPNSPEQSVTIHIPMGQTVVYSGTDTVKYDKLVVEGSLIITPDAVDVSLTVGTIVVEMMGSLDVHTDGSLYDVDIMIEGAIDEAQDPEQVMVGILQLGGNLNMTGNPVDRKMAEISQAALPGGNAFAVLGDLDGVEVGGELVLPDTQT
jgi:hypothetical protein